MSNSVRALIAPQYGGPEVLEVVDVADTAPAAHEVVIDVRASGINPIDAKIASGVRGGKDPSRLPLRLGFEASGVVAALGPQTANGADGLPLAVGDEVVAFRIQGAHASRVTVRAADVLRKPAALSFAEGASLLLVGTTAVHALDTVGVGEGDTVLIHGAGGSVGKAAIQLAVLRGARVIGTASAARAAEIEALGATPVEYGPGLLDRVRALGVTVDAAIDCIGTDEALEVSRAVLADPGRLVTIVNGPPVQAAGGHSIGGAPGADPGTELRDRARPELLRLAAEGKLSVPVVASYALEDARAAYEHMAEGHAGGKIVLIPQAS